MERRVWSPHFPDNVFDRLVEWFGGPHNRNADEAFQRRFLLGCDAVGAAIALESTIEAVLAREPIGAALIGAFGVVLVVLALLMRAGVRLSLLVPANLAAVAAFLFLDSIQSAELHAEQLAWLVMLPLAAAVTSRPASAPDGRQRPYVGVRIATVLALLEGAAIIAAHQYGWTFNEPQKTGVWRVWLDFVPLLLAVSAMVWMLDRLLRRAEHEARKLRDLLPVCAWCHKIRDAHGAWQTVDRYLGQHGAEITHGVCEGCAEDFLARSGR